MLSGVRGCLVRERRERLILKNKKTVGTILFRLSSYTPSKSMKCGIATVAMRRPSKGDFVLVFQLRVAKWENSIGLSIIYIISAVLVQTQTDQYDQVGLECFNSLRHAFIFC